MFVNAKDRKHVVNSIKICQNFNIKYYCSKNVKFQGKGCY